MSKTKKKRLGRGLDALLGETVVAPDRQDKLRQIPIDMLKRGQYQPRTHMDTEALEELSQSITARGVVQPIVVRPLSDGDYEIIAGERRWRAAQLAGLDTVPVLVRDIPDEAALVIALVENIQREDLNPIEQATGLKRLLDEFGLTHEQVAAGIGRSRSAVTNLLRLLTLSSKAKALLESGELEMGHARALLTLPNRKQDTLAQEIAKKRLSVRQTEALVRRIQRGTEPAKRTTSRVSADVRDLQDRLSEKLGAKVTVKDKKGKGKVVIEYHSLEQLDGILARIR
ncbi:MAG: ParB/RepB/Spo0J family partition protein [Arenicellales bacterium]|nr:ParB/RepB/Spo0J family partition protein [Arenicellales bacterium]